MEEPRYKLKTAPVFTPVTITQIKNNLRIDPEDTNHDTYLSDLLDAVIQDVQDSTGRQIARATYLAYLDGFPKEDLMITKGPVANIVSIKYYDANNIQQTMSSNDYLLDNIELTARLRFLKTYNVYGDRLNGVEIEFTCGWATQNDVPKNIKDAIILLVSERFLNPENPVNERLTLADRLLRNYKVRRF